MTTVARAVQRAALRRIHATAFLKAFLCLLWGECVWPFPFLFSLLLLAVRILFACVTSFGSSLVALFFSLLGTFSSLMAYTSGVGCRNKCTTEYLTVNLYWG